MIKRSDNYYGSAFPHPSAVAEAEKLTLETGVDHIIYIETINRRRIATGTYVQRVLTRVRPTTEPKPEPTEKVKGTTGRILQRGKVQVWGTAKATDTKAILRITSH